LRLARRAARPREVLPPHERVEQRRLADVGPAHEGELGPPVVGERGPGGRRAGELDGADLHTSKIDVGTRRAVPLRRCCRSDPQATRAKCALTVSPMAAGLSMVVMPASRMALSFSSAVPLPPEMMAPAWPMRRPGG